MAKLYYSIKEVSEEIDEEQHVLRYWEKEFSVLKPKKNKAGNRTYSNKDLIILKKIKDLLREQRIPVKDVKDILKKINWNLEKEKVDSEVIEETIIEETKIEKAIIVKELETNDITDIDTVLKVEQIIEEINEDLSNTTSVNYELVLVNPNDIQSINENQDKEIKNIESSLNFDIDKKIILKNHLFEDFEEFSIMPAEINNSEKEKNEKIIKNYSSDVDKIDYENDGVFISHEKLELMITILKEIRNII